MIVRVGQGTIDVVRAPQLGQSSLRILRTEDNTYELLDLLSDEPLATAERAYLLSDWAFSCGAQSIRHDYDLSK